MDDSQTSNFINSLSELLIKSEARIDRTNDMIFRLSATADKMMNTLNNITQEYCKHLNNITADRDNVVEQNTRLITLLEKTHQELQSTREHCEKLLTALLKTATEHSNEHNINITH